MPRSIKSTEAVAAIIKGDEFKDLSSERKHAIASQLAGAPNEFEMVFAHVASRAETDQERRFVRALVEDARPQPEQKSNPESEAKPEQNAQPPQPELPVATPEEVAEHGEH